MRARQKWLGVLWVPIGIALGALLASAEKPSAPPLLEAAEAKPARDANEGFYTTSGHDYGFVVDRLVSRYRPGWLVAVIVAIAMYCIGLTISSFGGFLRLYVRTSAIYLGCADLAWVVFWVHFLSRRIHVDYAELRPALLISDRTYRQHVEKWFRRIFSRYWNGVASGALAVAFPLGAWAAFLRRGATPTLFQQQIHSIHPWLFPAAWYADPNHHWWKYAVIAAYGAVSGVVLGSALYALIVNTLSLGGLGRMPVVPIPEIVRLRLRRITDFHVLIALAWEIGVGTFVLLFYRTWDVISITTVALLASCGVATLLVPQVIFRRLVMRGYVDISHLSLQTFYSTYCKEPIRLTRHGANSDLDLDFQSDDGRASGLGELRAATVRPPLWVYDARDIAIWFGAQVVLIGTVLAQIRLTTGRWI